MPFDSSAYSGYGQSMRDFANSVGRFSERLSEKRESEKQIKALKSAYRPFAEDLGYMSPEEFDNADAREITKRVQALHFKSGVEELKDRQRQREAVTAFGRDFGRGPEAPLPENLAIPSPGVGAPGGMPPRRAFDIGGQIDLPDVPAGAIQRYGPQAGATAEDPGLDPAFAASVQSYAQRPPASTTDRMHYALERNPEALMNPQIGEFIGNMGRLEALRAQQELARARQAEASIPQIPLGDYVGQTREVPGIGNMVFDGKGWSLVKNDTTSKVARDPNSVQELTTKDGKPTGKGMLNDGTIIDLSPTQSEGKELGTSELSQIAALSQAEKDIDNLEEMFAKVGKDFGGPLGGRVLKGLSGIGWEEESVKLEAAITAATPNLARGVFREVGVLTDEDIRRYRGILPGINDTANVRKAKFEQLRKRLEQGKRDTMDAMKRAGRNVSGFETGPVTAPVPAPPTGTNAPAPVTGKMPRFRSEAEAIAAGIQPGQSFLLYDPTTAQFYPTTREK